MDGLDVLLIDGELHAAHARRSRRSTRRRRRCSVTRPTPIRDDLDAAIARRAPRRSTRTSAGGRPILRSAPRCLRQLRDAMQRHADELRDLTVAEVGTPVFLTHGPQLDVPVDRPRLGRRPRRGLRVAADLGVANRWASRRGGPSCASRPASSARSRRGTSRTSSTSRSSARRSARGTRSSSSRRPTRRGARRPSGA